MKLQQMGAFIAESPKQEFKAVPLNGDDLVHSLGQYSIDQTLQALELYIL